MITIHFKPNPEKADKNGRAPVYLMAYYNGQRFKIATGEKCASNEWDEKKQQFRRSFAGYQEANRSLELLEERCRKVYRSYIDQGIIPSATLLREELSAKPQIAEPKKIHLLLPMFCEYLETLAGAATFDWTLS